MARRVNRERKAHRPIDPKTQDFDLDVRYLGNDFLKGDIKVGTSRHIILATDYQIQLLSQSFHWFVDGTFKLIKAPFTQLWSIHAFVRHGTVTKQVPLVFVLMPTKRKVIICYILN